MVMGFLNSYSLGIGSDMALLNDPACKIFSYVLRLTVQLPSWIQVLVTYDRYILVAYPNRFNFLKTRKFVAIITSLVLFSLCLLNVPNFFFYLTTTTSLASTLTANRTIVSVNRTSIACVSERHISLIRDMVPVFFRIIIPFALIIHGNSLLVKTFLATKKKHVHSVQAASRDKQSSNTTVATTNTTHSLAEQNKRRHKKESSFVKSIIAMDTSFIIILLPLGVTLIFLNLYNYIPSLGTPGNIAANRMSFVISGVLSIWASLFPCILTFVFNKLFRNELIAIFVELKQKLIN